MNVTYSIEGGVKIIITHKNQEKTYLIAKLRVETSIISVEGEGEGEGKDEGEGNWRERTQETLNKQCDKLEKVTLS